MNDIGGGTLIGRPVRAVQVGGPLGAYFPPALFDTPFDYEAFAARDGLIGHGGIVVFDDTVDLAKQARFAMEFCAEESCGKCTPCRIGSVRGMEVIDRIAAGERVGGEPRSAARPLPHDEVRFAVRAGRVHPVSGDERAGAFPGRFPPGASRGRGMTCRSRMTVIREARMPLIQEIDYGTPESTATEQVTLTIDGQEVTVPAGTSIMRAAMDAGIRIPKLCATDTLDAFGSCRVCLCEIEGRAGTPASCTTPVAPGMKVSTTGERVRRVRRGVMELYLTDHPLDGFTSPVAGNSEFQEMAGLIGVRQVRYGQDGVNHLHSEIDASNPYFQFDPARCIVCSRCVRACEEVQNTFALTIEGRGFDSKVAAGAGEPFLTSGVRLVRCLRAGLPDRIAAREDGDRAGPARAFRHHHLRLLRRRLQLQGRDAGRHGGAHGAVEGRQGEPRPFLREGPLRLGLCQPPGSHPEADDAREDHRSLARGDAGRRRSAASPPSSSASRRKPARTPSASSPRRAAPTKRPIWCRSWRARCLATTTPTPAPASAIRRPATGCSTTFGTSAGTQDFDSVEQADVMMVIGANPTDGHPVFASRMKKRLRQGAKLIVIDPRRIDLVRMPHVEAQHHLPLRPGTNVAVLTALAHVIVTEGLVDEDFVRERCDWEAFQDWARFVAEERNSPEAVAKVSGVPAADDPRGGAAVREARATARSITGWA